MHADNRSLAHDTESHNPSRDSSALPQLATANQRVCAYFLDIIFLMIGGGVCGAVGAGLLHDRSGVLSALGAVALWIANFVLLPYSTGQSLGKKVMNIAIVQKNYADIGILGLLLRETVGRWLEAVTLYLGTLGVVAHDERRTLHDLVGGSVVISWPRRPRVAAEKNSAWVYFLSGTIPFIGILAAIAIPNFVRFQQKAVQVEAKSTLKMAATAMMAHKAQAGSYATDLSELKTLLSQTGHYKYGFAQANGAAPNTKDTDALGYSSLNAPAEPFDQLAAKFCPDCVVNGSEYKILAVGKLKDATNYDAWTINEKNELVHLTKDDAPADTSTNN